MVVAAAAKLQELKHVRTSGTANKLMNEVYEMGRNVSIQSEGKQLRSKVS